MNSDVKTNLSVPVLMSTGLQSVSLFLVPPLHNRTISLSKQMAFLSIRRTQYIVFFFVRWCFIITFKLYFSDVGYNGIPKVGFINNVLNKYFQVS